MSAQPRRARWALSLLLLATAVLARDGQQLQAAPQATAGPRLQAAPQAIANPILFVTQVPLPGDFTTVASVFGNHRGEVASAPP